jgi:hypothetical protein
LRFSVWNNLRRGAGVATGGVGLGGDWCLVLWGRDEHLRRGVEPERRGSMLLL